MLRRIREFSLSKQKHELCVIDDWPKNTYVLDGESSLCDPYSLNHKNTSIQKYVVLRNSVVVQRVFGKDFVEKDWMWAFYILMRYTAISRSSVQYDLGIDA